LIHYLKFSLIFFLNYYFKKDPQYEDMFENGNYKRRRRMKRPYSMSNRAAAAAAAAAANTAAALNKSLFNSDALSGHIGRTFFAPPPYSPYVVPRKLYFA
jgi:hypothetical protein